jgi:hypothetical protein
VVQFGTADVTATYQGVSGKLPVSLQVPSNLILVTIGAFPTNEFAHGSTLTVDGAVVQPFPLGDLLGSQRVAFLFANILTPGDHTLQLTIAPFVNDGHPSTCCEIMQFSSGPFVPGGIDPNSFVITSTLVPLTIRRDFGPFPGQPGFHQCVLDAGRQGILNKSPVTVQLRFRVVSANYAGVC